MTNLTSKDPVYLRHLIADRYRELEEKGFAKVIILVSRLLGALH